MLLLPQRRSDGQKVVPDGARFLTVERAFLKIIIEIINVSALRYGLGKLLRRCLGPPSFGGDSAFESSKKYEGPLRSLTTVPFRGGAKKSFTGGSPIFKLTI